MSEVLEEVVTNLPAAEQPPKWQPPAIDLNTGKKHDPSTFLTCAGCDQPASSTSHCVRRAMVAVVVQYTQPLGDGIRLIVPLR